MGNKGSEGPLRNPLVRYVCFQIPGWLVAAGLLYWLWPRTGLDPWGAVAAFCGWVAKDFALWPLVRVGYRQDARTGAADLIGSTAVVQRPLDPQGTVRIRGELWRARAEAPDAAVPAKTRVEVVGTSGMTLVVRSEIAGARTKSDEKPSAP